MRQLQLYRNHLYWLLVELVRYSHRNVFRRQVPDLEPNLFALLLQLWHASVQILGDLVYNHSSLPEFFQYVDVKQWGQLDHGRRHL